MKKRLIHTLIAATLLLVNPNCLLAQDDNIDVVVIDAGHGGKDPGNLGTRRYNTREKDIALAVSLKLGAYIEQNMPNVKVVYTRKTDKFVRLEDRAEIANKAEADLFISIHCDAFKVPSARGATTLVMGRNHDDENMRVAMRENQVIYLEDNYEETYKGFDPNNPATYIALTSMQSAFLAQSISLAQKIQDQFRTRAKRRDRGVKQQPIYVTSRTVMPAVLVELGFLTNKEEEDYLNSDKGQSYMASAIYRAFKEYKIEQEELAKSPNSPTPDITKGANAETTKPNIDLKPVEPKKEIPNEVFFTVQIMTSAFEKKLEPASFKGVAGVSVYQDGKLYKYIVGKSSTLDDASKLKTKMKDAGFKDAFIIALSNNKRISIEEAQSLLQ